MWLQVTEAAGVQKKQNTTVHVWLGGEVELVAPNVQSVPLGLAHASSALLVTPGCCLGC